MDKKYETKIQQTYKEYNCMMDFFKKALPSRPAKIGTENVGGEYNIGDEREFGDGSTRRLGYSTKGVRRWMSTKEQVEEAKKEGGGQGQEAGAEQDYTVVPPDGIEKEEWLKFNQYLTEDNPFLNCNSYSELEKIWFTKAYEYDERLQIYTKANDLNLIEDVKKKIILLDNHFLALLMYKVSFIIGEIMEWEPEFSYEKFLKDKTWNDLNAYYEELKAPKEVDYSELYQADEAEFE